jgi:hypothetical protein
MLASRPSARIGSTRADRSLVVTQENFDGLPQADGFSGFDFPSADFNPHQQDGPRFPGPPTPPSNFAPNPYQHQQHNLLGHANGLDASLKPIHSDFPTHDSSHEDLAHGRNGSEEDDNLSPAQSRRKAQNRAAYASYFPIQQSLIPRSSTGLFFNQSH